MLRVIVFLFWPAPHRVIATVFFPQAYRTGCLSCFAAYEKRLVLAFLRRDKHLIILRTLHFVVDLFLGTNIQGRGIR
jgi:hypothetical protein